MAYTKGTILFKGDTGNDPTQLAKMSVSNPTDLAALNTFSTWLETISLCVHYKNSFTDTTAAAAPASPDEGANVDRKAVFVCQDTDTGGMVIMELPAPDPSIVYQADDGERVDPATVALFASNLATATGKNIIGLYGYVKQKK